MPPRRSCFFLLLGVSSSPSPVSMPPRRSCFTTIVPSGRFSLHRFNATTAFLLLSSPTRSRGRRCVFQCHHGVPASGEGAPPPPGRGPRFNATTAFLLRGSRVLVIGGTATGKRATFQCHHGVPASSQAGWRYPLRCCFNATTAFLLLHHCLSSAASIKSFNATTAFLLRGRAVGLGLPEDRFNATTAFLLPSFSKTFDGDRIPVSMPPRRSCFSLRILLIARLLYSFNATTAFLLRDQAMPPNPLQIPFQCHHGVPASAEQAG